MKRLSKIQRKSEHKFWYKELGRDEINYKRMLGYSDWYNYLDSIMGLNGVEFILNKRKRTRLQKVKDIFDRK